MPTTAVQWALYFGNLISAVARKHVMPCCASSAAAAVQMSTANTRSVPGPVAVGASTSGHCACEGSRQKLESLCKSRGPAGLRLRVPC